MSKDWCTASANGIRITAQIAPNARKSEICGVLDDALKIRLQAQPIEGKANEALVRFLAEVLRVPRSTVSIAHGHASRRKIIEVSASALSVEDARRMLVPGV